MMSKEEMKTERLYLTTMLIARKLYEGGTITAPEYEEIEQYFLAKYQPITGTLFSSLTDLLNMC